jgi:hypothetical protein
MQIDMFLLTYSRGEKADGSFRSMLQENLNSGMQETGIGSSQVQWREKLFSGGMGGGGESAPNEFKHQLNRGFSLDQPPFSPQYSSGDSTVTCQGMASSFPMDSALYGSPSTILQGLLGPDSQPHQQPMNFPYPASYGVNSSELLPSWSKVPQFLRTSPPKQQPQSHLHFSNNAAFWNASDQAAAMKDVRSSFFPSLQQQYTNPSYDEKPKV